MAKKKAAKKKLTKSKKGPIKTLIEEVAETVKSAVGKGKKAKPKK